MSEKGHTNSERGKTEIHGLQYLYADMDVCMFICICMHTYENITNPPTTNPNICISLPNQQWMFPSLQ